MSQTELMTASMSDSQSREIQPTTRPIETISTPAAQLLSHALPLVIASYFYLRFKALVADPVLALSFDLFPMVLLQCVHAIVCLPLSKRNVAIEQVKPGGTSTKARSNRPKSSRTVQHEADVSTKISNALLALLLTTFATLPIFVLLVLFGAPLTTHHPQTLLCAAHFSLLAVFPLFYTHGVEKQAWWEIGGAMLPFDSVWGTTIGVALGAWLGAVPIPLDWDREWQKWPITIVAGMYAGALLGNLVGRYVFYGKRLKFRPDNEQQEDKQDMKKKD